MIEAVPPSEVSWLKNFFSDRNALKWEAVTTGEAPPLWLDQVTPWVIAFFERGERFPLVLPVFDSGGPVQWYAMTGDQHDANSVAQELMAFIGPSFSDFSGYASELNSNDTVEKALLERFGRSVFRLTPVQVSDSVAITNALKLYFRLLTVRPEVPDRTQRPFSRIRAEFDKALLAGNEADAIRLRGELISTGRLDAEQEKYLQIRMLAGLGRQFQLAHDYFLIKSVLGLALPNQTLVDIVEALYTTYITTLENGDDEIILETFKREIANNFGPLFLERKGVTNRYVLKAFLLFELIQTEPNSERCQGIAATYPNVDDRALIERWVARLKPSVITKDRFAAARQALVDEDYDVVIQIAFDALPESWAYSALLRCAVELGEEVLAQRVLSAVDQASDEAHQRLTKRDLDRIKKLQTYLAEGSDDVKLRPIAYRHPDGDWLSWVAYVEHGTYSQPPLQALSDALPRWSVEELANNPVYCSELAQRIGNSNGVPEQIFRDAFVYLVEFFVDRPNQPIRAFSPIYLMLIRIVAWNGVVSANELELASTVLDAFVSLAPQKEDYTEAVDAFAEILQANHAPGNIDWAINAAELLALRGSPDSESKLRFFISVVDMARACAHRLGAVQLEILTLLAKDYECSELLESFPKENDSVLDSSFRSDFAGLIGIYTLTETAGQRAQKFLQSLLPLARVELNTDHVATDKLKNLASHADIFVFAWKSSKHQAYFAAKQARGSRTTLLPVGKGTASILDCVLQELSN